jgi:hypothetical protein
MKVSVRDPGIAADVLAYICRMGFSARLTADDTIHVSAPDGIPVYAARLELDLYLALWRVVEERDDVALLP